MLNFFRQVTIGYALKMDQNMLQFHLQKPEFIKLELKTPYNVQEYWDNF